MQKAKPFELPSRAGDDRPTGSQPNEDARANLAQTQLTIESMKKDYTRMQSDISAEQAQVDLNQVNFNRYAALVKTDALTRANYDQALFTLQADQSKLGSLKGQAEVQLAKLGGNADIAVTDQPQYRQAKAQVVEAQRELDHTTMKAPFAGIVTDVPAIAPGKYLQASTFSVRELPKPGVLLTMKSYRGDERAVVR